MFHRWRSDGQNAPLLQRIHARIEQSQAEVDKRRASIPEITFPDLPVSSMVDEITRALQTHQILVVSGETGSGKTTQLPKICLQAGRGVHGMIGHTQPRRIAARSVAERIAEECQRPLGQEIGYCVRFHDHTRPDTLVKLMTDGILLAETRSDPYLSHYDTLIVDEAHERSLNTDFLLGYIKWLLPKRPDLKLIITSATIDTRRFAEHFNAPVIEVSGRTYPVECRYRPLQGSEGQTQDMTQGILGAVEELQREGDGDILIFLSGERDIRDTAQVLQKSLSRPYEILPLYGRLSAKEQTRIFRPHGQRRIVLATNVAETSLTVPGIRYVIDSGLARISRYSLRSKIQRLPIEPISQASANQRAGRCGRVAPGICIRLYGEDDFSSRPEFTDAEIMRTNLAAVILQMKHLQLGDMQSFPFLESPDPKAIRSGIRLLQELNALDRSGALTEIGRQMARLPIDPRFARILVEANRTRCVTEACVLVAALSIQDPRERPAEKLQQADEKQARFGDERSDFIALLNLWQAYQNEKKERSKSGLRRFCGSHFLSFIRMCEWEDIWRQIVRIASRELKFRPNHEPADYPAIHGAIVAGMLSHIGFKQDRHEYLGARNLKFQIHPGSSVRKKTPKWVVASEQVETSRVFARTAAAIEPEWIEQCAAHVLKRHYSEPHWSRKQGRAMILERLTLYGLTVVQGRKVPLGSMDPALARDIFIRSALVEQDFQTRAAFFLHNQQQLEQAGYLQHKHRRVDLVVDAEWLYAFYDDLISADVVDVRSFERWRKRAEQADPKLLFLKKDHLLKNDLTARPTADYPDILTIQGLKVPLSYRFEPGAVDDGVTARVELHQLNQLDAATLSWLVPGLLRDKVVQLLRGLPKPLRRRLGPIPDCADDFLQIPRQPSESLNTALQRFLQSRLQLRQRLTLDEQALDPHLRMNIRLMKQDQVLEESFDLDMLKARYALAAESLFQRQIHPGTIEQTCKPFTDWEFEPLLVQEHPVVDGQQMTVYPALDDAGEGVLLRRFDTRRSAQQAHAMGVLRLLKIALSTDIKYLRKHIRPYSRLDLMLARLSQHPLICSDRRVESATDLLVEFTLKALFLDQVDSVRSKSRFEELLARKPKLVATANGIADLLSDILVGHTDCRSRMGQIRLPPDSKIDIESQLGRLVYQGFLQDTALEHLCNYPRYLKGLCKRLERLAQSPDKDRTLMAEIATFEQPYWASLPAESTGDTVVAQCQSHTFRWLLEEYRISLFAQPLKTSTPVSAKRLTKAWSQHLQEV